MLQIAAHNAADVQVLGFAGNACPDTADAADDHVDPDAGAAGLFELQDDVTVADGVILQNHGSGAAQPCGFDDPVHLIQQDALESQRRHQHLVGLFGQLLDGQVLEHACGFLANIGVGSDEGQVGVQLTGFLVVVAGTNLGDVGITLCILAGDQGQLGVNLVVLKAVNHSTAGFLQLLGPVDVVLFIKAGPQLHQSHHFLAVFSGIHQSLHNLGLPGQAVQGHLDGDDLRVPGSLLQHGDEGADGLVWIVQQHIVFLDFAGQAVVEGRHHGPGRRIEQFGMAVVFNAGIQLVEEAEIQRALLLKDPAVIQLQAGAKHLGNLRGRRRGDLEPDGCQLAAALEQLGHDLAVIDIMIHHAFFDVNVGVPGDPEQAFFQDGFLGKNHADIVIDHFFGEGKLGFTVPLQEAQALHLAGNRDDAQAHVPFLLVFQQDAQVNLFVPQEREGMAVIHNLRAQDREQLALEVFLPEPLIFFGDLVKVHLPVAVLSQGLQSLVIVLVAVHLQLSRLGHDGIELFLRGHIGFVLRLFLFAFEVGPLLQGANAHHKELVQVGPVNGQKFQLLRQRDVLVLAQHQDPLVKIQPAQFPVDKNTFFLHSPHSPSVSSHRPGRPIGQWYSG